MQDRSRSGLPEPRQRPLVLWLLSRVPPLTALRSRWHREDPGPRGLPSPSEPQRPPAWNLGAAVLTCPRVLAHGGRPIIARYSHRVALHVDWRVATRRYWWGSEPGAAAPRGHRKPGCTTTPTPEVLVALRPRPPTSPYHPPEYWVEGNPEASGGLQSRVGGTPGARAPLPGQGPRPGGEGPPASRLPTGLLGTSTQASRVGNTAGGRQNPPWVRAHRGTALRGPFPSSSLHTAPSPQQRPGVPREGQHLLALAAPWEHRAGALDPSGGRLALACGGSRGAWDSGTGSSCCRDAPPLVVSQG